MPNDPDELDNLDVKRLPACGRDLENRFASRPDELAIGRGPVVVLDGGAIPRGRLDLDCRTAAVWHSNGTNSPKAKDRKS